MNPLVLYLSIVNSIATALFQNTDKPGKVREFTGYLNLASALAARGLHADTDLAELDRQLKIAVTEHRGLTPEQRAAWRARSDISADVADQWLKDHPLPGTPVPAETIAANTGQSGGAPAT